MKLNNNKCHFYLVVSMKWCGQILTRVKYGRARHKNFLASLFIEIWNLMNFMKFDEFILKQCKNLGRKLSARGRICKFLNLQQRRRSLKKAFVETPFAYCPFVWMLCSRSSNNSINHRHNWAPIIVDNYHSSNIWRSSCKV